MLSDLCRSSCRVEPFGHKSVEPKHWPRDLLCLLDPVQLKLLYLCLAKHTVQEGIHWFSRQDFQQTKVSYLLDQLIIECYSLRYMWLLSFRYVSLASKDPISTTYQNIIIFNIRLQHMRVPYENNIATKEQQHTSCDVTTVCSLCQMVDDLNSMHGDWVIPLGAKSGSFYYISCSALT